MAETIDRKFVELAPFYANGTLGEADRAWVEAYARAHPSAAAELRWLASLEARVQENVPPVAQDIGLERTMARIRAERPAQARVAPAAPSLGERLRSWLAGFGFTPALALAAALVVAQAGVIVSLVRTADDSPTAIRSIPKPQAVEVPHLRLNFKPEARESDIRMLLIELKGEIVAGPGQLGDYYVRVPGATDDAIAKARASTVVEAVDVVPGVPPKIQ